MSHSKETWKCCDRRCRGFCFSTLAWCCNIRVGCTKREDEKVLLSVFVCRKFLPQFRCDEVRRRGGKGLPRASAAVLLSAAGSFPRPHWDQNNPLVSFKVWPEVFPAEGEKNQLKNTKVSLLSESSGLFFTSCRLAINICGSPTWLGVDVHWKIDACFLRYCSNFLLSHGGTQNDVAWN